VFYRMIVTILAFIVVLGITITIHEFGHFAMAKLLKIRVLVFSLGFGPRLAGFTRGGTEYRLSPIPLGGYVKMAGEAFDEERSGSPEEFLSHPKWHRFLVALAGPFMNIALAVVILTVSYMEGVYAPKYLKQPPMVGPVVADSAARRAGLATGDRILSVRGNDVHTWEEMEIALATTPKDDLDVIVLRGGEKLRLHFEPPEKAQIDTTALGFKYSIDRTIVASVSPNSPAQSAGLQDGDEILSVRGHGQTGRNHDEILNIISASKGIPLSFEVRRSIGPGPGKSAATSPGDANASTQTLQLTITPIEDGGRVMVGFFPEIPGDLEKFGVAGAVIQSIRRNYEMSALTFRIIGRIFKGSASVKTISGPLEIARISGSAARSGSLRVFIGFLGIISLQLGVFNLLPIPVLDGGVIALILLEGIIRRDLNLRLKERIMQAGILFLILLMGLVVVNDLSKMLDFNKLFR
jgi:regulator of sigma E protease